jgi:predicted dinucleotide-binding enzyme
MKVGILGSGSVARALGSGFLGLGDEVMLGTRVPEKLQEWASENPGAKVGSFQDTARFAQLAVLAVKGAAALEVVRAAGPPNLDGKTVMDATNPIADTEPVNGVLNYFTDHHDSLMEQLQREFGGARFVKAFNSVGAPLMVNPRFEGGPPTMFICGNHDGAKQQVTGVCDKFGWDVVDMGTAEAARAIEPLAMLWCIPGFRSNEWTHAFKLLR